ncbi:MAG: hypothetical protein LC775_16010, partial [Acidobacteria bacterium]|nr:hypothetical protein [Acidobacteriota bacterium]
MKSILKNVQCVTALFGIIMGLVIAPVPKAFANSRNPDIFPPDKNVFGLTYGDRSVAWWQYVLSIPTGTNPSSDTTGANCGVGQS